MGLLKKALCLKSRGGFPSVLSLLLAFSVAFVPYIFHASSAYAAAITTSSDTLTREKFSEDSNHTIEFDTPTGVDAPTDTITVTFAASFDLSSVLISDVDFEVEGTGKFLAPSAGAGVWGYSRSGQIMTFTAPTDAAAGEISVGDTITVKVGTVAGTAGWDISTLDSGGIVGSHTSIAAVDSDTIFVSYYDQTNSALKVAKTTNGGSSWTTSTVDNSATVGTHTSIAAVTSSTIYISYYAASGQDLKVAKTINGGSSWTPSTVDSADAVGQFNSISAVDSSTVYISYFDQTNKDLKFAKSINGGSSWSTSTEDSTGDVGFYTSIAAIDTGVAGDDTDDTIFISYFDDSNDDLKFAKTTNGGSSWTPSTVDSGSVGIAKTSIAAVDSSTVFISYWTQTGDDLTFAKTINGGTDWTTSTVDSGGDVGEHTSIAAVDSSTIFISYYDADSDDLKVAKTTNGGTNWTTSFVDEGGNVGQYTSIAAVDSNTVFVSYYDVTNSNLEFARTVDFAGGSNQITNPGTVAAYGIDIGGTFGDSGTIYVPIVDDDRVTITASVQSHIQFDLDINDDPSTAVHHPEDIAAYGINLGTLIFTDYTDEDDVEEIYVDFSTNASGGMVVDFYSANTSLDSASTSGVIESGLDDTTLDTDDTDTCAVGCGNYGVAAEEHGNLEDAGTLVVDAAYVDPGAGSIVALPSTWDTIFSSGGAAIQGGDGRVNVRAISGTQTPAADDYLDTLYFRATATF